MGFFIYICIWTIVCNKEFIIIYTTILIESDTASAAIISMNRELASLVLRSLLK